ncbi:hypothetical protein XFEB_01352 [Xylella fastidiosa EB92.1]|nr:hypothetical protein XFEB_01352 [Xylella fastidiosa EB92.1]
MFTMVRPESDGTKRRRGTLRLPGWPCGAVHEAFLRRCKPDQVRRVCLNRSLATVPPLQSKLEHNSEQNWMRCG